MGALEDVLRPGLAALGIEPDDGRLAAFRRYYDFLTETNEHMNLTAISGEERSARLHFLDCCALLGAYDMRGRSVIDVGSGAGFPGLPLKLVEPTIELTMLDSLNKRVEFLREACGLMGVDARCVAARAEEAPGELRGSFDIAVSRAVARLSMLAELCLPFVRVGGAFIAMKGPEAAAELAEAQTAIAELGGGEARIYDYTVPGADAGHSAVVIKKTAPTPEKYPRRWARIAKKPL